MPRASEGTSAPPVTALLDDSAAMMPSGSPLPIFSRRGEERLASPELRKAAVAAPVPGRMPTNVPMREDFTSPDIRPLHSPRDGS